MSLRTESRGFSLIEVMVAVLILGVALTALVRGITTALAAHKDSERLTTASLLAAGRLEFLRADGVLVDGSTEGTGGDGLANYRWRQTIAASGIEGLKEVTVVVEETETRAKLYELVTLLFDPPLDPLRDKSGATGSANQQRERRRRGR